VRAHSTQYWSKLWVVHVVAVVTLPPATHIDGIGDSYHSATIVPAGLSRMEVGGGDSLNWDGEVGHVDEMVLGGGGYGVALRALYLSGNRLQS